MSPAAIIAIFTTYTRILGENILFLDIATFVVAVVLGQVVSKWLLSVGSSSLSSRRFGLLLLGLQLVAYSTLTFFPPRLDLFMDPRNGTYGIPARLE